MRREDLGLVPTLSGLGTVFTILGFHMNQELDGAEGWNGSIAWTAYKWDRAGKLEKLLAISLGVVEKENCQKQMMIAVPGSLEDNRGSLIGVLSHAGTTIYDQNGRERAVKTSFWGEIDRPDLVGFLTPTENLDHVSEVREGSSVFKDLEALYRSFRIFDLEIAREYVYKKYGAIYKQEVLEAIAEEDSIVSGFVDWLGRDWKLFLTYPFIGLKESGLVAGVVKIMSLPSIWGDKINKPGYMEYLPRAIDVTRISLRILKEYGACLMSN